MEEYFGDWLKVIDIKELISVVDKIKYTNLNLLCPKYSNIFKAFKLCSYKDCKVIFIGQD